MAPKGPKRKYHAGNLIPMFRLAARLRNEMIAAGFTDNGGAIHSAERILNILGIMLKYPTLSHQNNLRKMDGALFSVEALAAHEKGSAVKIEHVSPIRDFTRKSIAEIDRGASDEELATFVRANFELVLLTPEQALDLNKRNRSTMDRDRMTGFTIVSRTTQVANTNNAFRTRAIHGMELALDNVDNVADVLADLEDDQYTPSPQPSPPKGRGS